MRLKVSTAPIAALVIALAGSALAQQGTAGAPRATTAPEASLQAQLQPSTEAKTAPTNGSAPIVLAPGTTTTITTAVLPEPQPGDSNAQRARSQPLNNAPFWRGVRNSGNAPGTVNNFSGGERGVLIQPFTKYPGTRSASAGEAWRQIRNWWVIPFGGSFVVLVVLALGLYYWARGPLGGHVAESGRVIERFTYFERAAHWANAVAFSVLAISGLVMAFGKFFLLPITGGLLFGWLTYALKTAHNFAGPLFAVSLVIVFLTFLRSNWPSRDDLVWLLKGGGLFGGEEPPSHRFNAGEKIVFWGGVFLLGTIVVCSGFVLDKIVPGLETTRPDMQVAHIVHAIAAVLIIALFFGHIYIGTIGMRGAYRAMKTGYVDEAWAREHHRLWYEDIVAGKIPAERSAGPRGVEQPAA